MSTTDTDSTEPTLNGIPMSTVLTFLSERGQLELQLAVEKATVHVLKQQVASLDTQVQTILEEKPSFSEPG